MHLPADVGTSLGIILAALALAALEYVSVGSG